MSNEIAAALLPGVPALLERCRALAALSAICPDEDTMYEFVSSLDGERLSIHDQSRVLGVDHGPDGTLVWAWDVDMLYEEDELERTVEQVPAQLLPRLAAMAMDSGHWLLSVVMWRLPGDETWSTAHAPADLDLYHDQDHAFSLSDLTDPSPGNLWLPGHFGQEYGGFSRADAIRQVLALRPLTEEIVRAINPARSLADVDQNVAATGYRPAPTLVPLDRGIGDGDPLVAVHHSGSLNRFYFESDGTGHHRIMLHHSGKAIHVCGDSTGAAVVQREPDGSPAQLFLLEEYRDGGWHTLADLLSPPEEDYRNITTEAFRIRAKDSGLVLGVPDRPGEAVRLEEPREHQDQAMTTWLTYGYGVWAQLPIGVHPPATPYEPAVAPV
ncbi:RICIN domain-containing protein [Streptomyces rubiginosohelvolus]|uniref:RICIN domain-containing protein n=1 Tax=Streptomyces rubiginosohelvolus TaxID=67362 RepID=UPI00382CDBC8